MSEDERPLLEKYRPELQALARASYQTNKLRLVPLFETPEEAINLRLEEIAEGLQAAGVIEAMRKLRVYRTLDEMPDTGDKERKKLGPTQEPTILELMSKHQEELEELKTLLDYL